VVLQGARFKQQPKQQKRRPFPSAALDSPVIRLDSTLQTVGTSLQFSDTEQHSSPKFLTSGWPTIHPESRRHTWRQAQQAFPDESVVVPQRHHHGRAALEWRHSAAIGNGPRSKVENQIARHCELIMPSTVVVSLQIPGTLETQFRTYLDGCADPMTPRDCVL
jgi:hypothetical protein